MAKRTSTIHITQSARGPAGELLSSFSLTPLEPGCWDVVEERTA